MKKTLQITEFKEQLILELVEGRGLIQRTTDTEKHKLVEQQNNIHKIAKKRNMCSGCYQKIKGKTGRDIAQKTVRLCKVRQMCKICIFEFFYWKTLGITSALEYFCKNYNFVPCQSIEY